jgi:hypothetical protein
VTGECKTLASKEPNPIDSDAAKDLLAWYRVTPHRTEGAQSASGHAGGQRKKKQRA